MDLHTTAYQPMAFLALVVKLLGFQFRRQKFYQNNNITLNDCHFDATKSFIFGKILLTRIFLLRKKNRNLFRWSMNNRNGSEMAETEEPNVINNKGIVHVKYSTVVWNCSCDFFSLRHATKIASKCNIKSLEQMKCLKPFAQFQIIFPIKLNPLKLFQNMFVYIKSDLRWSLQ